MVVSGTLDSCAWLPSEFNLSPIYRHRLADDGSVLEMDVLWPIVHYETLANGGTDCGGPGPRPQYGPDYYAAFVRDPDGHKLEVKVEG